MANNRATSDEQIIAALMECKTVSAAAAAVGLSPRAMYDRMSDPGFMVLYKGAKADVLRAAVAKINSKAAEAVETIAEIMNSKEASPAVRLQAAQAILNHAGKFAERLDRLEDTVAKQADEAGDPWTIKI